MTDKTILIATTNNGKMNDIKEIFKNINIKLISFLDFKDYPEVEETGSTFESNAILKANAAYDFLKLPVIADDSGMAVEQLMNAPGVYSARFAGKNATDHDNNVKLITELQKYPEPHLAKYICVAVYYNGEHFEYAYGECSGKIIHRGKGTNGFGYDPHFVPDGYNLTMGELSLEEKSKISHRRKAFEQLKRIVSQL